MNKVCLDIKMKELKEKLFKKDSYEAMMKVLWGWIKTGHVTFKEYLILVQDILEKEQDRISNEIIDEVLAEDK